MRHSVVVTITAALFMVFVRPTVMAGECPSTDSLTPVSIALVENSCLALDAWEQQLTDEPRLARQLFDEQPGGFGQLKKSFDVRLKQKLQVVRPPAVLSSGEIVEAIIQKTALNGVSYSRISSKLRKVEIKLKGLEKLSSRQKKAPYLAVAQKRSRKLQEATDDEFQRYQQKIVKLSEFEASSLDAVLKAERQQKISECVTAMLPWIEQHVSAYRSTQRIDTKGWRIDLGQIDGCWVNSLSRSRKRASGE